MLQLRPFIAPKRYVFVDPNSKHLYKAATKEDLILQIEGYRSQNRLPKIEALHLVLENYWCSLPENTGLCQEMKLKRGVLEYVQGGVALVRNYFYGEKNMVDQVDADVRASTCVKCPHNTFPDRGAFITWSDELAEASTGGRKSILHDRLGNCEVCTCCLKAKVWFKGPFKLKKSVNEKLPIFCWQKNN